MHFILVITVLIISAAIMTAALYGYDKPETLSSGEIYKDIIDNCVPSSDIPVDPTISINNGTHSFQLQTCKWIGTNGVNMSQLLWDNFINTFQ